MERKCLHPSFKEVGGKVICGVCGEDQVLETTDFTEYQDSPNFRLLGYTQDGRKVGVTSWGEIVIEINIS